MDYSVRRPTESWELVYSHNHESSIFLGLFPDSVLIGAHTQCGEFHGSRHHLYNSKPEQPGIDSERHLHMAP